MPSTTYQKAKEKRSTQSDIMSDIENLDVMLRGYQRDNCEVQERNCENEMDLRSTRQEEGLNQNDTEFRSYLNTNFSENSGLTEETSRAINLENSPEMSRKLEEMKSDLNAHILDAIDTAIEEKVIPSIKQML